jgi:hypothetical protein
MKALLCWTLAASAALSGLSRARSAEKPAEKKDARPGSAKESSAREKLVGAWRLAENGVKEQELIEAITHLAFYSGWPNAMSAIMIAKELFSKT